MTCRRFAFLLTAILAASSPAQAVDLTDSLVQELSQSDSWRALLHYRRTFLGSVQSEIDSPAFFLSPTGHDSPDEELRASAAVFGRGNYKEHAEIICKFPARYDWLRRRLEPKAPAPEVLCPALAAKVRSYQNARASIVFAESYRTNPASMFGHSFLRFDNTQEARGSDLLAPAISFAAKTDGEKGFFFAAKGLTGLYRGVFFHAPYHIRVRQYNDLDRRNLWEYHLNFSREEIRVLLLHLWELQDAHFDYYFFDENCSYHLLGALEAARPKLHLRENFFFFAIPTDTIRVLTEAPELLEGVDFRPSQAERLRQAEKQLSAREIVLVKKAAADPKFTDQSSFAALSDFSAARVLETAVDYAVWREESGDVVAELQRRRSRIAHPKAVEFAQPPVRPDQGHYSSRITAGLGNENSTNFVSLSWRPAYHDLYEMPGGYLPASSLTFAETEMRYDSREERVFLEELNIIDLESYSQRTALVKSWSWNIGGGLRRYYFDSKNKKLIVDGGGGVGVNYQLSPGLQAAVLMESRTLYGGRFKNNLELGLGPSLTLLFDVVPERFRIGASVDAKYLVLGSDELSYRASLTQTVGLSNKHALRVVLERREELGPPVNAASAQWLYYFY